MKVVGLTGGIGMGKSFIAAAFARHGIATHDADREVHALMARGGRAVLAIERAFPGVVRGGAVDRRALGARVFGDEAALARLEAILHPAVRRAQQAFLQRQRRAGRSLALLDVPLLLETGNAAGADLIVVASAPPQVQASRVLRRPGMSASRLESIRARQMSDREKRRRADVVILTGLSRHHTQRQVRRLLARLRSR